MLETRDVYFTEQRQISEWEGVDAAPLRGSPISCAGLRRLTLVKNG